MRVLLVDDEQECGDFLLTVLENAGSKVQWVKSAEAAVDTLKTGKFDVVVTDKNLPNMDGIGLIKHIRENYGSLPVVLVTGQGSVGSAVDAFRLGAQDYLLKPLEDPEILTRTVWSVTEQRRLGDENKILQQKLLHAEKMESLGMLAAGIAHEINNPTSFILGNMELLRSDIAEFTQVSAILEALAKCLESGTPADIANAREILAGMLESKSLHRLRTEAVDMVDEAIDGSHRIKRIVGSLRCYARTEIDAMEPVDINDEIEKSLTLVWNDLKYKCTVKRDLQKIPEVFGNASQLDQVLVNIFINAGQAIDGRQGIITVKTSYAKPFVKVEISDNGHGIPPEVLSQIFDPFFTTKDVGLGTGLGLYIAYGIMKQHGGSIDAHSKVGEGSTFVLSLPERIKEHV